MRVFCLSAIFFLSANVLADDWTSFDKYLGKYSEDCAGNPIAVEIKKTDPTRAQIQITIPYQSDTNYGHHQGPFTQYLSAFNFGDSYYSYFSFYPKNPNLPYDSASYQEVTKDKTGTKSRTWNITDYGNKIILRRAPSLSEFDYFYEFCLKKTRP